MSDVEASQIADHSSFEEALTVIERLRERAVVSFPGHELRRPPFDLLVPPLSPRFFIEPGSTCFTIGSCFSRNVEEALADRGMTLPTKAFHNPPEEWPWRHNGLLNEYNPGSIAQRIEHALDDRPFDERTLVHSPTGVVDLMLPSPGHANSVSLERARARRAEIRRVYRHLERADVIIVTLGMVEAWFDRATGLYLNRKPLTALVRAEPQRFAFRRLDVDSTVSLLEPALASLLEQGVGRVLLAVSPVPFNTSFSGRDAYVANTYSKSVLRAAAEALLDDPRVDYLPSFEIVTSGGAQVFTEDNMHIDDRVVRTVVDVMLEAYASAPKADPTSAPQPLGGTPEDVPGHRPACRLFPASSVILQPTGQEGLLFDLAHNRYFSLNRVARIVWETLEAQPGLTEAVFIEQLVEIFGVDRTRIEDDIHPLLASWRQHGLLTPT